MDAGSQALAEALRSSFAIVKFVMVLLVLLFLASGFFTGRPAGKGDHSAVWQAGGRRRKGPARCRGCIGRCPIRLTRVVKISDHGNPEGQLHRGLVCGDAGAGIERQRAAGRAVR